VGCSPNADCLFSGQFCSQLPGGSTLWHSFASSIFLCVLCLATRGCILRGKQHFSILDGKSASIQPAGLHFLSLRVSSSEVGRCPAVRCSGNFVLQVSTHWNSFQMDSVFNSPLGFRAVCLHVELCKSHSSVARPALQVSTQWTSTQVLLCIPRDRTDTWEILTPKVSPIAALTQDPFTIASCHGPRTKCQEEQRTFPMPMWTPAWLDCKSSQYWVQCY
jgi:hypothetical protein